MPKKERFKKPTSLCAVKINTPVFLDHLKSKLSSLFIHAKVKFAQICFTSSLMFINPIRSVMSRQACLLQVY